MQPGPRQLLGAATIGRARDTEWMNDRRGAYTAERAAALSGVPKSTVHHWARKEWLVPSVSPTRVKLWSYTDLMGLRAIYWLRHPKPTPDGEEIPPTPMSAVREALAELDRIDLDLWHEEHGYMVRVSRAGEVYVGRAEDSVPLDRQLPLENLDLIEPFESEAGIRGPDLVAPRSLLRIVAGKLAGAPHLLRTRLETEALAAISRRGIGKEKIYGLYPKFDRAAIDQALDLETQLARNLEPVVAVA
jgi:uncharacterized protein (DUF433 family)